MTSTLHHIIHRETFELTGQHQHIHKIESEANRIVTSILHPEIEHCFDEFNSGGEHLIIDKLEIDLGVLYLMQFENEIKIRLRSKLDEALNKVISNQHNHKGNYLKSENEQLNDILKKKNLSLPSHILKSFLHYLIHGYLPWWWENDLQSQVLWKEINNVIDANVILQTINSHPSSIPRAVATLTDEMLGLMCEEAGYGKAIIQGWSEIRKDMRGRSADYVVSRNIFWEYCLSHITGKASRIGKKEVIYRISRVSTQRIDELDFFLTTAISKNNTLKEHSFDKNKLSDPSNEFSNHAQQNKSEEWIPAELPGENSPADTPQEFSFSENQNADPPLKSAEKPTRSFEEDFISVTHSGAIIVHPFLGELFQSRDLIKDNKFISDDAACHGVRLLDYLASGRQTSPESELILPKLLCGIDWADSIPSHIQLNQQDLDGCDTLLRAIIYHWKVLGNTSENGLRNGFFARQGVLAVKDNGWLLKIEHKAQDILLNKLPWGISTIKLPWMHDILHTSWI